MRKSFRGGVDVSLRPLVLLDRNRTLCVNGALSAGSYAQVPKRTLFLALVDDRQRGTHPNLARALPIGEEVNSASIAAVGTIGNEFVVSLALLSGVRYLAVSPQTLGTRWIKAPTHKHHSPD
jgi:hypothetical protein